MKRAISAPRIARNCSRCDGCRTALTICEDAWNDKQFWERQLYQRDPVEELSRRAALACWSPSTPRRITCTNASCGATIFEAAAKRYNLPVVYVNQVGGNDQLVFDGSSFAMDRNGKLIAAACSFDEDLVVVDTETGDRGHSRESARRVRSRVSGARARHSRLHP